MFYEIIAIIMLLFGVFFGKILSDKIIICKLLKKLTKKHYGIVGLVRGGRIVVEMIKCFDKDIIKIGKKTFLLQPNFIFETKSATGFSVNDKYFYLVDGVPMVFFDVDDLIPLKFENVKLDAFANRLPEHISAIMDKEIALAEAEIMSSEKKKMTRILLVILIITAISCGASLMLYFDMQKITLYFNQTLEGIKNILQAIKK